MAALCLWWWLNMAKSTVKLLPFLLTSLILLVSIHLVNILFMMKLNHFGILPRHGSGLYGIILHPFLHANWQHLAQNLVSFSVLVALAWPLKPQRVMWVLVGSTVFAGCAVWLVGRESIHIGLSGVVYALWAYILVFAIFQRSIKSLVIAVVVMFLYASLIWGLLPVVPGMSFETHLFGALAGGLIGYWYAKRDKKHELSKSLRYRTEQELKR